jgi:hypothetical protein
LENTFTKKKKLENAFQNIYSKTNKENWGVKKIHGRWEEKIS